MGLGTQTGPRPDAGSGGLTRAGHSGLLVTFLFAALVIAAAIGYAPAYLNYSDPAVKADAVVLFLGSDNGARHQEATRLIESGFADRLIIPASWKYMKENGIIQSPNKALTSYPRFYENTHIEVLEAKREMDLSGFRKAIFVSSPSHMRRIRIIATHVFGNPDKSGNLYEIAFVPARSEESPSFSWLLDIHHLEEMMLEYAKMAWFCLYKNT
ncbi:MAG TPA: hypothetical protein VMT12_03225 [Syntrophales bacterium]|nr:hypothetical protein [Syntrophales bacterium]